MSEHARGYGTVVTSQANFLRVVVTRESMTQAHLDERALRDVLILQAEGPGCKET